MILLLGDTAKLIQTIRDNADRLTSLCEVQNSACACKFIRQCGRYVRLAKCYYDALQAKPGQRVLEIGPGTGYLLWWFHYNRVNIEAIDCNICDGKPAPIYPATRKLIGVDHLVRFHRIEPNKPIPFDGLYDFIISTLVIFSTGWTQEQHMYFIRDCWDHLAIGGKLILSLVETSASGYYFDVGSQAFETNKCGRLISLTKFS